RTSARIQRTAHRVLTALAAFYEQHLVQARFPCPALDIVPARTGGRHHHQIEVVLGRHRGERVRNQWFAVDVAPQLVLPHPRASTGGRQYECCGQRGATLAARARAGFGRSSLALWNAAKIIRPAAVCRTLVTVTVTDSS